MKNAIFHLLAGAILLSDMSVSAAPADPAQDLAARPAYFANLRGGFLLDTADSRVEDRWEHDTGGSYLVSAGAFRTFPRAWRQFYFFAGPEFSYAKSEESITGTSNSYLTSTFMQAFLTGGLTWRPDRLGGNWTFSFSTAFEIWGEQQTELTAAGYKKSLDKTDPKMRDSVSLPPFLDNAVFAFGACYDLSWEWSACMNYESRGPSTLTAGVNFGF